MDLPRTAPAAPLPRRHAEYVVARARLTDLPQIARMEAAFFPEPLSLWGLFRLWVQPITTVVVVRRGRRVAAYIGFQKLGPAAHTISMAVHPDHRRQGLATLVQRTADAVAAARGCRWFTGEVGVSNAAQLRFLDGLGWRRIGVCPRFFGDGEDAVVVWNWLEPGAPGAPGAVSEGSGR